MPEPQESAADREKRERRARQEEARRLRELLGTQPAPPPEETVLTGLLTAPDTRLSVAERQGESRQRERSRERSELAARLVMERQAQERQNASLSPDRMRGNVQAALPAPLASAVGSAHRAAPVATDALLYGPGYVLDPGRADARARGTLQGVTLGFGDELAGAGRAALGDTTYTEGRDADRRANREARELYPGDFGVGQALGSTLPALLVPTAGAETVGGRVLQAGGYGAGFGAVEGFGSGEGDAVDQLLSTARGAGYGFVGGAGGQLLGEGVQAARRARAGEAQDPLWRTRRERLVQTRTPEQADLIRQDPELRALEDERRQVAEQAARHRIMATAPGATRADLDRALDTMEAPELADRLRDYGIVQDSDRFMGIVPESADAAQQRARFMREDAGRRIGATEAQLAETAPVDLGAAGERLRQSTQGVRGGITPTSQAQAADVDDLIDRMRTQGQVPYRAPEGTVSGRSVLDEQARLARYGEQAADANRPWARDLARDTRRAVRQEMDVAAEQALPPEQYQGYRQDRRRFGAAATVDDLAQVGMGRATGNRQLTLTDTIAGPGALPMSPSQVLAIVQNRFIRGREQAFMASLREGQASALAREVSRRLAARGERQAAAALEAAARRGSPVAGVLIREWMDSDPQGPAVVASVVAEDHQFAQPGDPTGGLGGEPTEALPVEEEEHQFADPDDPTAGF